MANIANWKRLGNDEVVFDCQYRKLVKRSFRAPDERQIDFTITLAEPAVVVLPLTSDNLVILAKQFRPGPEKVFHELPGGLCDHNEEPPAAAFRELREETGYTGCLSHVASYHPFGYSTRIIHCYVTTHCYSVDVPKPDTNEFIEVELVTIDQFRKFLREGELTNIEAGYLGLDHLKLL